jgi:hypothetical protein
MNNQPETQARSYREEITLALDTAGRRGITFELGAYAVRSFDGAVGSVVLSSRQDDSDPRAIVLLAGQGETIAPSGCSSWWLINRTAQPGCSITVIVATSGHTITPGTTASTGSANAANQALEVAALVGIRKALECFPHVLTGVVTVGVASAQMASVLVPEGCAGILKSSDGNTGTITLSSVNPAVAGVGFTLAPGSAVSLRIDNLSLLYHIADLAGQTLEYIVEKE